MNPCPKKNQTGNCGLSKLRNEAIVLEFEFEWNWENSAEVIAEDYYYNHDGWEDDWPVLFRIWDEEGLWVGDYEVSLDFEPTFNATEVTE